MLFNRRKKYIALLLVKEQESYSRIRAKRINPTKKEVSFRGKTYEVDMGKYLYSRGLKQYYFIDIEAGQLFFSENPKNLKNPMMHPEILDLVVVRKFFAQVTSNLQGQNFKLNLGIIIIGLIMGGLLGFVIAGFV